MTWAIPFFILTLPLCLVAAWSDLKSLRIQNGIPILFLLAFVLSGLFVLPLDQYLWRLAVAVLVFIIGIVIYATGLVGGGDIKTLVAMAPFIATHHWLYFALILSIASIGGIVAHKVIGVTGLAPKGWKSWEGKKGFWNTKFPFGFILSGSLMFYLATIIAVSLG